uniref:Uncharacterized protein LOC102805022 n=1 Tax=Saccoglossus kowalevskii TaxID=10224 RepID=A0ABM0MNW2_SACKO|nr:PREDICTED: uncharacterized protein LOC102805022 [Saccoglossus kowalevskii]
MVRSADEIKLILYRNLHAYREDKALQVISISSNEFCGMECNLIIQRRPNVLSIVCLHGIVLLGFDQPDKMIDWQLTIHAALGYFGDQKFTISLPNRGKLSPGPATLYLSQDHFAVTTSIPVKVLASWNFHDLARYGNIDEGFAFEASRTASSGGIFVLLTDEGDFIRSAFDAISRRDVHVNSIRQSFESEANIENRPLLTFTNECMDTIEKKSEEQVQGELTKRDIMHFARRTSVINIDDSFTERLDSSFDISTAFLDPMVNRRVSRKASLGQCLTKKSAEEFELKQKRKMSVPNCMTTYCNPQERFSGGHLEDYGVLSEIHDLEKYTSLSYRTDKLKVNGMSIPTHGAITPEELHQRSIKTKDIYIENLKNDNSTGPIREQEYELMAPLTSPHETTNDLTNSQNRKELIRDAEYELMAPLKNSQSSNSQESDGSSSSSGNYHFHTTNSMTLIRDAEYELMGPLAPVQKTNVPPNGPIREAEYELMHPRGTIPCPYRNLPSNSKLMQQRSIDLKNNEVGPVSGPIRDIEYEIMSPQKQDVNLTQSDSDGAKQGSGGSYIDFRKHIMPRDDKKDLFTMLEFGHSAALQNSHDTSPRPLPVSFKLLTPPSSPTHDTPPLRPRPVTCKLQGVSTEDNIPAPFEHSELLLPTQLLTPPSNKSESQVASPYSHAKDEGKISKKSKRKRCVTEPTRTGSPNVLETEAEQKGLLSNKTKNSDGTYMYERKRSLTDPEILKARDKSKVKSSFRKSRKKSANEKRTESISVPQASATNSKMSGFKFKKPRRGSSAKDKMLFGSMRLPKKATLFETTRTYSMVSPPRKISPATLSRYEMCSRSSQDWPMARKPVYHFGDNKKTSFQRPRTGSEYEVVHTNCNKEEQEEKLEGAVGGTVSARGDCFLDVPLPERQSISSTETLDQILSRISLKDQAVDTPDRKSQCSSETGEVLELVMLGTDSLVEECFSESTHERNRKISHSRTLSLPDCSYSPWMAVPQIPVSIISNDEDDHSSTEMKSSDTNENDDNDVDYAEIDFIATQNIAKQNIKT